MTSDKQTAKVVLLVINVAALLCIAAMAFLQMI